MIEINVCFVFTCFSDTLRRELQPLTDKVDGLYRSHNQRYDELKSVNQFENELREENSFV